MGLVAALEIQAREFEERTGLALKLDLEVDHAPLANDVKLTVYRLVHSGDLPAVRFGRSFRIPESAVVAAIQTPISDVG